MFYIVFKFKKIYQGNSNTVWLNEIFFTLEIYNKFKRYGLDRSHKGIN